MADEESVESAEDALIGLDEDSPPEDEDEEGTIQDSLPGSPITIFSFPPSSPLTPYHSRPTPPPPPCLPHLPSPILANYPPMCPPSVQVPPSVFTDHALIQFRGPIGRTRLRPRWPPRPLLALARTLPKLLCSRRPRHLPLTPPLLHLLPALPKTLAPPPARPRQPLPQRPIYPTGPGPTAATAALGRGECEGIGVIEAPRRIVFLVH